MTNTHSAQALGERIEALVQEYISETRSAAQAAMDRAFATSTGARATKKKQDPPAKRRISPRRPAAELAALGERLHAAMCETPGETMMVLAPALGCSARDLQRPLELLKRAGRIRTVGRRQAMRYYPMAGQDQSAS